MFEQRINIIESSSAGNLYSIQQGDNALLVEAGVQIPNIDYNFEGCLISHEHKDHSRYAKKFAKYGIDCYMTPGTINALDESHYRFKPIEYGYDNRIETDNFIVIAFEIDHDAKEPAGFLISTGEDRILYISDTSHIKYKFRDITHLMIECNYDDETLEVNVKGRTVAIPHKQRVARSHLSLKMVIDYLKKNDLSKLKEIYLLHLSSRNANVKKIVESIKLIAGVPVYTKEDFNNERRQRTNLSGENYCD